MELFWQEALLALPDQLAPLLGSGALSGAAPAEARVGVDICSDDGRPAPPPYLCFPGPCDPEEQAQWLTSLKCPGARVWGLTNA